MIFFKEGRCGARGSVRYHWNHLFRKEVTRDHFIRCSKLTTPFYEFLPHGVESYDLVSPGIFKTSYSFKILLLYACSLANQIIRAAGIPERSCIHIARVTPPRCGRDVLVRGES